MAEGSMLDDTKLESPIDKALLKSFPKLVTCIAKSPGDITDQLVPLSILSDEERNDLRSSRFSNKDKARTIMKSVMIKVKSEPSFVDKFISILEKYDWMKHCTDELKKNLKLKLDRKSDSIGARKLKLELTKCSISASECTKGENCVKSIYPPTSRKRSCKETEKFDEGILEYKTDQIKQDFASLVTKIAMALEKNAIAAFRLLFYLSALRSVRSDNIRSIKECYFSAEFIEEIKKECENDVYKILTFLGAFYSWINFGLIESIKNTFLRHDEEIQTAWEDYKRKFKEYCKERMCEIPQHTIQTLPATHCTEVAFKIDSKWKEIRLDMLITIKAIISRVLELEPHTLYLSTVKQGCVELVFEVPQHVADVIFPPTEEQLLALQEDNIRYCRLRKAGFDTTESSVDPFSNKHIKKEKDDGYWSVSPDREIDSASPYGETNSASDSPHRETDSVLPHRETDSAASNVEWKIVAIGERNAHKYEIINGLLGQESISCPTSHEDSATTKIKIKGVYVEVIDLNDYTHLTEYISEISEVDTILCFLPEISYHQTMRNITRECDQQFWEKCIIIFDSTDTPELVVEKILKARQDIDKILLNAKIPTKVIKQLQIVPRGEATSLHLPGYENWFSILCWTVLGVSSTSSQNKIVKFFYERTNPEHIDSKMLYLQSIHLPADNKMSTKTKAALAAASLTSPPAIFLEEIIGNFLFLLLGSLMRDGQKQQTYINLAREMVGRDPYENDSANT